MIRLNKVLRALLLGLALGAGAEVAVSANAEIASRECGVEHRADLHARDGLIWVASNGSRASKKVFKRFWARTAYV